MLYNELSESKFIWFIDKSNISILKDHMDKPIVTVINVVSPQKHIATIKHERGVTTITSEIVNGKKVLVSIS